MRALGYSMTAAMLLLPTALPAATSASFGTHLTAIVPVVCKLARRGEVVRQDGRYDLGELQQYCNSPTGYVVEVDYQPGTMRGTALRVGDHQILLDGSGHGEVARAPGPRVLAEPVTASADNAAFDPAQLAFRITPL